MKQLFCLLSIYILLVSFGPAQAATPPKIVSAGGSVTEILFALEQSKNIVAVDSSSMYPHSATELPSVGYYRQMNAEGVISTGATVLIASEGAGPAAVLSQIEDAGIDVHVVKQPRTIEGLMAMVKQLGELVGEEDRAHEIAESITTELTQIQRSQETFKGRKVAFFMSVNQQGIRAAGNKTTPDLIFSSLELDNIFSSFSGYQAVSSEALLMTPPELVLIPAHQASGLSPQEICNLQVMSAYASLHGCNVHIVDSLKFLGMTPRLPEAVAQVSELLSE